MVEIAAGEVGTRLLLVGNEAIARGAIEGGVRVVTGYPGTPSSEIVETLIEAASDLGFYAEWSINEKVAFELAAGASLTGVRALAVMKNAGFNVIMDMFMTLPYGGVRGGLVVVVADDPGAHYSSNEQDSRFGVQWASVPCLEPESQREAKEMTKAAFGLSERIELPVVVRTATRLSHSKGVVELGSIEPSDMVQGFNKHWKLAYRWNVYGPPSTESKHVWQLSRMPLMHQESETSPFNTLREGSDPIGVVACGMGAAYAREAIRDLGLRESIWFCKVGMVYPVPEATALRLLRGCKRVLVVEDGGPLVESQLRLLAQVHDLGVQIIGKLFDGAFALHGELNTNLVRGALAKLVGLPKASKEKRRELKEQISPLAIPRSSTLCAGCSHLGTYWALRRAMKGATRVPIVDGDIGCYEQAGYGVKAEAPEPTDAASQRYRSKALYNFLDTLYVMGSGISMAQGQERAGYRDGQIVAVAGDSTFFHACMPSLLNAVWNGTRLTFIVMDNSWTAMTGHQPCPATGQDARGDPAKVIHIDEVARALGAGLVQVVDPYRLDETEEAISRALDFHGVAVVVARHECALQVLRREGRKAPMEVVTDECTGCTLCVQLGCPAITFLDKKVNIDELLCVGCGICAQLCPTEAITGEGSE